MKDKGFPILFLCVSSEWERGVYVAKVSIP